MTARLAALVGTIATLVVILAWVDGIAPRILAALFLVAVTLFTGMVLEATPNRKDPTPCPE